MMLSDHRSEELLAQTFSLRCPHCLHAVQVTPVSIPSYEQMRQYPDLSSVGICYVCNNCFQPIFLKFSISYWGGQYDFDIHPIPVEHSIEQFEYEYLPKDSPIERDFREALRCYSYQCYNAFAAMCRRTIQSVCADQGASGKDKIMNQLKELKELTNMEDSDFEILKQIVIEGHDGAHPHLPEVSQERAGILLELMKSIIYDLYVKKAKLQKAMELRNKQIAEGQKQ